MRFARGAANTLLRVNSGATDLEYATADTANITDNAVSNAKLADMAGFTVRGKPTTGTGDPTDITMAADTVLGRSGSGDIDDITLVTNHYTNDSVTFPKIVNIPTDSLIGRDTASTGDPENILLNSTLEMDGSGNLRRAALTGDVTASAGSNATTIANNAVTDAKIASHTTTKITTTSKSLLNSAIVYNDQSNVMGDFDLEMHDNRLIVWNPARTFKYTVTAQAITGDVELRLPTGVTGINTIVVRNSTETLMNKTIETDNNTLKHSTTNTAGDLLKNNGTKFDRFAVGTSLQLLRVNSGATDLEWFSLASGDLPNHASRHQSGGADAIKLDDLAAPDDNTDLNASTSAHGLLSKLPGGSTNFLREDGTWAAPPGAGGGEANTASNLGSGQGVFKSKVGVDLQFRSLTATSSKISLANNTNDIGIDVTEANLTLGNIGGTIGTTQIAADAVTFPKIVNIATDSLIGRDTASSGDPENILLNATLEMDGSGNLRRAALTGDVTASAGNNATTIANDAVSFAKFQNIGTDKLLGRDTTGTGDPEEIGLASDHEFTGSQTIRLVAFTGDVTKTAGGTALTIANDAVTFAKMANMNTDKLLGRDTASSGDPEEIGVNQGIQFDGSGNIQVGTIDPIDNSANDITHSFISNFKRRFGYVVGKGDANTSSSGFWSALTVTTTSAAVGGLDADGAYIEVNTGTTSNTACGLRTAFNFTRLAFNPRILFRFTIPTVTNTRFYAGLKSFTTAFPATDTPLGSSDSGVVFGYRSTDSNALKIFYNDGSAGITVDDCSLTIVAGTTYDIEIVADDANSKFKWRKRSNFGSWSAYTDITSNLPASATNLGAEIGISNSSGVNRTLDFRISEVWSDK